MVTEERMQTLFAHANPVPDASSVEFDPIGAAAYLENLEERSSAMTKLETATRTDESKNRGWRPALAGAAAVAAIAVVGVVLALSGGGSDDGPIASDDLVGVWESVDGVFLQFNEDGTYSAAWTFEEVSEGTFEKGTWSYDGVEFVWVAAEGNCPAGQENMGRYSVSRAEGDAVQWTVIWDPCIDRLNDLSKGPMRPVSS